MITELLDVLEKYSQAQMAKKTLFDRKFDIIEDFNSKNQLRPIKEGFFDCINIEVDFLSEVISIGNLCSIFLKTYMERKKLELFASKLDHRINTIDAISRRCQNAKNFDISHLTKDARDELSKIFVDFNANFLKTAQAISLGKGVSV